MKNCLDINSVCLLVSSLVSFLSVVVCSSTISQIDLPHNSTSVESPTFKINRSSFLDITGLSFEQIASKAKELTSLQSLSGNTLVTDTRKTLAKVSLQWATVAQAVTTYQYSKVIYLTRKAQEAQLLSLIHQSAANLVQDAVMKANEVHNNALERYRDLSALAKSAETNLKSISESLKLLQKILVVRNAWATEERARAFRLSFYHLQVALKDLQAATKFAQDAHFVAVEMIMVNKPVCFS